MEILLFLWYSLWLCLCTPKFYPKYFYPKYSKSLFLLTPMARGVEIRYILSMRPGLFVYINIYIYMYTYIYVYVYIFVYICIYVYIYVFMYICVFLFS